MPVAAIGVVVALDWAQAAMFVILILAIRAWRGVDSEDYVNSAPIDVGNCFWERLHIDDLEPDELEQGINVPTVIKMPEGMVNTSGESKRPSSC